MDATPPTETNEGCRLDAQESRQGNIELFPRASDERASRLNQHNDSSGKRKERGFHTFEGYAAIICLAAGKLELAVPVLF